MELPDPFCLIFISMVPERFYAMKFKTTIPDQFSGERDMLHARITELEKSVSRLKDTIRELRKNALKYRLLIEHISDVLWTADMHLQFRYVTPSAARLLGYSASELLNTSIDRILTPSSYQTAIRYLRIDRDDSSTDHRPYRRFVSRTLDLEVVHKNGSTIWTETKISFIRNRNRQPVHLLGITRDITKRKKAEDALVQAERAVQEKSHYLEEANTALKVLLKHSEQESLEIQGNILTNVKHLIMPYIDMLKKPCSPAEKHAYINILETNLTNIVSPFFQTVTKDHYNLTPKEIQVANLVKDGKSTKDIATVMNLSVRAIEFHRENIRKKLGLKNSKMNLRSHLLSLS